MTLANNWKSQFESALSHIGFGETFTVKTLDAAYGDTGIGTKAYSGSDTFTGDWQSMNGDTRRAEAGLEQKSDFFIIAHKDSVTDALNESGGDLIVKTGDFAGTYTVNYINRYNSHNTVFVHKTKAEDIGTIS